MATIGTLRTGPDDARHALPCCRAMLDAVRVWNVGRGRDQPIRIWTLPAAPRPIER